MGARSRKRPSRTGKKARTRPAHQRSSAPAPTQPPPSPTPTPLSRRWLIGVALVLVAASLFVYLPIRHHDFIAFDDPQYVSENVNVLGGVTVDSLSWAVTSGYAGNWHPLTWLSHMVDIELFGLAPGAHHLMSLGIHIGSGLLLFLLLYQVTGAPGRSAFVALLFTLHPLRVESVSWVAERKDVLSTFLWVLTLLAYVRYVRMPNRGRYLVVFVTFALGLMAKPMLVTLPMTLLLLDVWPLRRVSLGSPEGGRVAWSGRGLWEAFRPAVLEKIPLFALTVAVSVVTVVVQRESGAVQSLESLSVGTRLANAVTSYMAYIGLTIWPHDLGVLYPYAAAIPAWQVAGGVLALAAVTVLAIRWLVPHPYVAVGWFWYLGTLVPVVGLMQAGSQPMADRFTYVPTIGLLVAFTWLIADLLERRRVPIAVPAAAAVVVLTASSVSARAQVGYWETGTTLWEHTLAVTANNYRAHSAYGFALAQDGRLDEAVEQYQAALAIRPSYPEAHNNLGTARVEQGAPDQAIQHFTDALQVVPDFFEARTNLGLALAEVGRADEAIPHLREAVRLAPDDATIRNGLGHALAQSGNLDDAAAELRQAIRLAPDLADAHVTLGLVAFEAGRAEDAARSLATALRLDPNHAGALNGMGDLNAALGRLDEAEASYRAAIAADPSFGEAHNGLGRVLVGMDRIDDAIAAFEEAADVSPEEPDFHYDLGVMYARLDRIAEAVRAFEAALERDPAHVEARQAWTALTGGTP